MSVVEAGHVTRDAIVGAREKTMLIDGAWVAAASGKTFDVFDPSTDQVIATAPSADSDDVDRAVSAARRAFEGPWSALSASDRARLVWRLGDLIEQHADELARLESLDNGKPIGEPLNVDIPLSAECFRYMAGWATKLQGTTLSLSVPYTPGAEYHAYTLREPIGVVGQIIPWNFPLMMAAWKLAPALAAGCTVVLKPAEQTPLTALRLGELIQEAGFPDGVVNILTGFGETAGAAIAAHPGIDKVAFTGSTEVGKLIVQAAGRGNLKKVSLELGGKSPTLIFDDAEIGAAVGGTALASFFNQGQVCTAGSRVYAHKRVFDDVASGLADNASAIHLGNGLAESTTMGPLVSREQFEKVSSLIESGLNAGAEPLAGGRPVDSPGYFVQPTVLANVNPSMRVQSEEIFGPVITVAPFDDLADVIDQANDTDYGLAAGVWTSNLSQAHRAAKALRAGTVYLNCYHVLDATLPFGGFKQSGWGRELGENAMALYTDTKSVCAQLI